MKSAKSGPKVAISVIWADLESVPLKQVPPTYAKLVESLSTLYGVPKTNLKLTYTDGEGDRSLIFDENSFLGAKHQATASKSLTITASEEEKSGKLDLTDSTGIIPTNSALSRLASFYIDHQTQMSPLVKRTFRKVLKGHADEVEGVDLGGAGLDADNARCLARLLPQTLNLTSLRLRGNLVKTEGLKYLLEGLQTMAERKASDDEIANHRPPLTELTLEENEVGEGGGIALGIALRHLTGLTVLKLDGNRVGDGGAESLARTLPLLKGLQNLGLDGNDISDVGLAALAGAVHRLRCLSVLWLEKNQITNNGAEALATVLPHSLKFLWVGGNLQLDQAGLSTLRNVLGQMCQVFA